MRTLLSLSCVLLAMAGCRDEPRAPIAAPVPSASAADPNAPPAPLDNTLAAAVQRLQHEREHRPTGAMTTDRVAAFLETSGVKLTPRTQVLGLPLGASYCENANSTDGKLGVSICEYESAEAAAQGRAKSLQLGAAAFPNRTLVVNGQTMLSLNAIDLGDSNKTVIADLAARFGALPSPR